MGTFCKYKHREDKTTMKPISYIIYPLVICHLHAQKLTTTLRGTKGVHHQITRVLLSPSRAPTPRHPNKNPNENPTPDNVPLIPSPKNVPSIPDQSEVPSFPDQAEDPEEEEPKPTSPPSCNESK